MSGSSNAVSSITEKIFKILSLSAVSVADILERVADKLLSSEALQRSDPSESEGWNHWTASHLKTPLSHLSAHE